MSVDLEALKAEVDQLSRRVEKAELLQRTVQLYGIGYLLQHGNEQVALKPSDVTIVLPADAPASDFDLRARIEELEREVAEVGAALDREHGFVKRHEAKIAEQAAEIRQLRESERLLKVQLEERLRDYKASLKQVGGQLDEMSRRREEDGQHLLKLFKERDAAAAELEQLRQQRDEVLALCDKTRIATEQPCCPGDGDGFCVSYCDGRASVSWDLDPSAIRSIYASKEAK